MAGTRPNWAQALPEQTCELLFKPPLLLAAALCGLGIVSALKSLPALRPRFAPGTSGTARYGWRYGSKIRIANVYRPWYGGTAPAPPGTPCRAEAPSEGGCCTAPAPRADLPRRSRTQAGVGTEAEVRRLRAPLCLVIVLVLVLALPLATRAAKGAQGWLMAL